VRRFLPRIGGATIAAGVACLATLLVATQPVAAHTGEPLAPHDVWSAWDFSPPVVLMLLMFASFYWLAVSNLWSTAGAGRGIGRWQAAVYYMGLLTVALALLSPLDPLAAVLFSAHMVQHVLLIMIAAPLLALGAPSHVWLWALPLPARRQLARWWRRQSWQRRIVHLLGLPLTIWLLSTLALWLWHAPQLYEAALYDDAIHALEHATFVWTAWLLWGVVFRSPTRSGVEDGVSILVLFTAAMQSGLLGALMTFAPKPWYPSYMETTAAWGISALADQQLAGVIMWVPAGTIYLVATLALLATRLARLERQAPALGVTRVQGVPAIVPELGKAKTPASSGPIPS
jgi:putative membrane protein